MSVTRFAGTMVMHDRGITIGRLIERDDHRFAAVIRHPVSQEELVVGVLPTFKEACADLWRVHSMPRDREPANLNRSSAR